MEKDLVSRENIPFQSIPAAGVHGVSFFRLPGNILQLLKGYFSSRKILHEFNPDVLFFTGGYVAIPMALAGVAKQSLLYVPDVEPGLALKTIARYADHIAITAPESREYLPGKPSTVTGYPVREDLKKWNRQNGREFLGISSDKPVVLIFGGSKGAHSINLAVTSQLPSILEKAEVIHISGSLDWELIQTTRNHLPVEDQSRYHIFDYLHEMGAALASADLVVSRAGASTLGEYPLFGLPSILVPYPYAWRYQKVNADKLVNAGAAIVLENNLLASELSNQIEKLLGDVETLKNMSTAAKSLSMTDSSEAIAGLLLKLSSQKGGTL